MHSSLCCKLPWVILRAKTDDVRVFMTSNAHLSRQLSHYSLPLLTRPFPWFPTPGQQAGGWEGGEGWLSQQLVCDTVWCRRLQQEHEKTQQVCLLLVIDRKHRRKLNSSSLIKAVWRIFTHSFSVYM